jgi:energy-coupling factor transporter ATP-binding protein EcfA2
MPNLDRLNLNTSMHPLDNLAFPKMFDSIISAAKFGLPVVVAMSGPSGSGKSTVAAYLKAVLNEQKIEAEIFSTDSFYMVNGIYNFDPSKLQENHTKNIMAFKASKAQVRIIDNTNLNRINYANYFSSAEKAICIVLYMKELTSEQLAARSIHGLSIQSINNMLRKFKIVAPSYYGLFPLDADLQDLIIQCKLTQTQKTPPHMTSLFIGGSLAKDKPPKPEKLNTIFDLHIIGYSINEAGQCLVTNADIPGNHITLMTNNGFNPVDVGTHITESNTTMLPKPLTVRAIYLPFY